MYVSDAALSIISQLFESAMFIIFPVFKFIMMIRIISYLKKIKPKMQLLK